MRIWITRAAGRAESFCRPLREAGEQVVALPVQEAVSLLSSALDTSFLTTLSTFDGILLTSARAVDFGLRPWVEALRRLSGQGGAGPQAQQSGKALQADKVLSGLWGRLFCVGQATASACEALGVVPSAVPAKQDAQGLLERMTTQDVAGKRYLFPCSQKARDTLPVGLRRAGAEVLRYPVYDVVACRLPAVHQQSLLAGEVDLIAVCSPSQLAALAQSVGDAFPSVAPQLRWAAIGPTTAQALRERQLPVWAMPTQPGMQTMAQAILAKRNQSDSFASQKVSQD